MATLVANRNRLGVERLIGPLANTVILAPTSQATPNPREVIRKDPCDNSRGFRQIRIFLSKCYWDALERERAVKPATLAPGYASTEQCHIAAAASLGAR